MHISNMTDKVEKTAPLKGETVVTQVDARRQLTTLSPSSMTENNIDKPWKI